MDRSWAIGVVPERGVDVDAVRSRLVDALSGTSAEVYVGDARGSFEFIDAANARVVLISLAGMLGGTALVVAILVVAGTFALSVQQRLREIALLRAVAATPRQVRGMIGREALVVGLAAGGSGCAAGALIASWLRGRFIEIGALPANLRLASGPIPVLLAGLITLAAAWIASRLAARRTIRLQPTRALNDVAVEPGLARLRLLAGLGFLVAGVVTVSVLRTLDTEAAAMPVAFVTVMLWTIAVALLGPIIAQIATAAVAVPLRRLSPVGGYLAAAHVRSAAKRLGAMITPLALAIAVTCTVVFVHTTMGHAAQRQVQHGTRADHVLQAIGPGLPAGAADAAASLASVAAVTEVVRTSVWAGRDKYEAQGVTPVGLDQTMDLDVRSGSLTEFDEGSIAVSNRLASRAHAGVGDQLDLTLGDGTPVTRPIVAVYERGLGFGDVTLPYDLVAAHVDNPLAEAVLITATPDAQRLRASLDALTGEYPGLEVLDRAEFQAQEVDRQQANARLHYLAMGLIVAFSAIAVVNTLASATVSRSQEFALLPLIGTTRQQVLRMLSWESLAVTVVATAIGTLISSATLVAFGGGMTPSPLPYVPPLKYGVIITAAAALTFLTTTVFGRIALQSSPTDVINVRT